MKMRRITAVAIAIVAALTVGTSAAGASPEATLVAKSGLGGSVKSTGASSSATKPNFDKQRKLCWEFRERSRVRLCLKNVNRRERSWKRRNTLPTMTMVKAMNVAKWAARKTYERQWPGYEPSSYSGYWAGECALTARTAAQCEWSTWMTYEFAGGVTSLMTCEGLVDLWYVNRQTIRTRNHTIGCSSE